MAGTTLRAPINGEAITVASGYPQQAGTARILSVAAAIANALRPG